MQPIKQIAELYNYRVGRIRVEDVNKFDLCFKTLRKWVGGMGVSDHSFIYSLIHLFIHQTLSRFIRFFWELFRVFP